MTPSLVTCGAAPGFWSRASRSALLKPSPRDRGIRSVRRQRNPGSVMFAPRRWPARCPGGSDHHSSVTIGAQPLWNPSQWPGVVRSRSSLRGAAPPLLNKGVRIESWSAAEGALPPTRSRTDPPGVDAWPFCFRLCTFSSNPRSCRARVDDRLLFVARRDGHVVAFLVASPVTGRNGYLVEELARSAHAPNGTSELLIDAAMMRFAHAGCTFATLGLVALAQQTAHDNPLWLRSLMALARAHANRFYNFRGLEHFRAKMNPDCWEKIYAISEREAFLRPGPCMRLVERSRAFRPCAQLASPFGKRGARKFVRASALGGLFRK